MKEAIGGTSLFFIVIVILSVFAIYISLSVNWNTAYKVKDEIIFYIEKNNGVNKKTIQEINSYLADVGYFTYGDCPSGEGWNGFNTSRSTGPTPFANQVEYCIAKVNLIKNTESTSGKVQTGGNIDNTRGIDRSYYAVRTFFMLDLPIVRRLGLTIDGETRVLLEPDDFPSGLNSYNLSNNSRGVWDES